MANQYTRLTGQRVLIMGLADEHSIAWGCAKVFSKAGAHLAISCLNEKAEVAVTPLAQSLDAVLLRCDVTQPGAIANLVKRASDSLGGLDCIVHSIAWAPLADLHGRVVDSSAAGFGKAMDVSCHSFMEVAQAAESVMHQAQGGSLITMSYLGAQHFVPNYGLMGPVKAALEAAVKYMAAELGPKGIRVHGVSPGPIATRAASGIQHFDELQQEAIARAPMRRSVSIDEVGSLVAFLASPSSSGMTGQTIYVDGGMHAVR